MVRSDGELTIMNDSLKRQNRSVLLFIEQSMFIIIMTSRKERVYEEKNWENGIENSRRNCGGYYSILFGCFDYGMDIVLRGW